MAQMDNFHAQHMQVNDSGGAIVDFPQSQELFSDQEHSEHGTEGDTVIIPHGSDTLIQNDNSDLFQDEIICTPTRTQQTRKCKKLNCPLIQNADSVESSDYDSPPRKLTLKEIFDNHFRKNRKRKTNQCKKTNKDLCTEKKLPHRVAIERKPFYSISLEQRKRRLLHCGIRFPFASRKHLPLKLCFAYEQYVLGGFLNHVKDLKCSKHLQTSLLNMMEGGELEEGGIETRKFKYLDDEEPLSPISEEDDENETEHYDAKIVENSSFILECRIPSKEQWKIMQKISKAAD